METAYKENPNIAGVIRSRWTTTGFRGSETGRRYLAGGGFSDRMRFQALIHLEAGRKATELGDYARAPVVSWTRSYG